MNFFLRILFIIGLAFVSHYIDQLGLASRWEFILLRVIDFCLFALSVNVIYNIILYYYRKGKKMSGTKRDNITTAFKNIYYLILGLGFVVFALRLAGIDIRTLFTSLSIVAAAIAIVFKDFISPVIAGFFIAFSRELNIDDYVQLGAHKGKVINMSLSKLSLLNEDDDLIVLPNDKVYQSELVNFTRGNVRKVSINFEISSMFEGGIEELENNLVNVLKEYHEVIEADSFNLKIVDIHKDWLELKFQYVLTQVDRLLEREIRKKTVRQVVNYLREKGKPNADLKSDE